MSRTPYFHEENIHNFFIFGPISLFFGFIWKISWFYMILKKKISKKYFRQLYRALFLVVFVVSGNLFQIEMGIIQKVLNLEIYIKWSPLAIAVLFKMKKKKGKSEKNCDLLYDGWQIKEVVTLQFVRNI